MYGCRCFNKGERGVLRESGWAVVVLQEKALDDL